MIFIACPLCAADNWTVRYPATLHNDAPLHVDAFRCTSLGYGEHLQIVQCKRCGHIYANPTWEPGELLGAYEDVVDELYLAERAGRVLTFENHLQSLQALTGPANGRSLLDVGAYIGVFVDVAQAAGWQAQGIEPSAWAVCEARRQGLPVRQGTLDDLSIDGARFDVITMWDVIEHLADPRAELVKAHRLLKPGGLIALHTMNVDSLTARLLGRRWPWYMAMHVQFFSKRTLSQMVEDVGFKTLATPTEGRYLRLGYLTSRLYGIHPLLGKAVDNAIRRFNLAKKPVPVNFGDLFTLFARR